MRRLLPGRRLALAGVLVLAAAALLVGRGNRAYTADSSEPDRAAVDRARTTAHMLDDLYVSYVVHVTDTYVKAQERTPAAHVTKQVFKDMEAKGWHSGRLVDATGEPINKENRPSTDFEKKAVQELKAGKASYEEVGTKDGKPVFRSASKIPAVMKACTTCHAGVQEGDLMGALVLEVPIRAK